MGDADDLAKDIDKKTKKTKKITKKKISIWEHYFNVHNKKQSSYNNN